MASPRTDANTSEPGLVSADPSQISLVSAKSTEGRSAMSVENRRRTNAAMKGSLFVGRRCATPVKDIRIKVSPVEHGVPEPRSQEKVCLHLLLIEEL